MNNDGINPTVKVDTSRFDMVLPCYAQCPACGSREAKREYDYRGAVHENLRWEYYAAHTDEERKKINERMKATPFTPRIKNTCTCGYAYDTKPLNAQ